MLTMNVVAVLQPFIMEYQKRREAVTEEVVKHYMTERSIL